MAMGSVSTSNAFDRAALRTQANAIAFTQQEPSPLTVMLTKMRYEFDLARMEVKKGKWQTKTSFAKHWMPHISQQRIALPIFIAVCHLCMRALPLTILVD